MSKLIGLNPTEDQEPKASIPVRIMDLEALSGSDINELKKKTERSKGVVQVLVHPFFRDDESTQPYKDKRAMMVAETLSQDAPFLIFEEEMAVHVLLTRISGNGVIYTISTLPGDARPASMRGPGFHPLVMKSEVAERLEFDAWQRIMTGLKWVGVQHVFVGGKYMTLLIPETPYEKEAYESFSAKAWNNGGNISGMVRAGAYPEGCAGKVLRAFASFDFDTSMSYASEFSLRRNGKAVTVNPQDLSDLA